MEEKYLGLQVGFSNVMVGVILSLLFVKTYGILDKQSPVMEDLVQSLTLILIVIYYVFSVGFLKKAKTPKLEDVLSGRMGERK